MDSDIGDTYRLGNSGSVIATIRQGSQLRMCKGNGSELKHHQQYADGESFFV